MGPGMFPDLTPLFKVVGVVLLIAVPLGAWKLFELAWYVWSHLHWGAP